MTEAEEKIEVKKDEAVTKISGYLFSQPIETPKLKFYGPESLFTEPIMFDDTKEKVDNPYQLFKFDGIEAGFNADSFLYENLLMAYMLYLLPKHRKPFVEYQASIHEDSVLWLDELTEFWSAYYTQVKSGKFDERLFNIYVDIIESVKKEEAKKEKKYLNFEWLCETTKLIEVALALELAGMVKYPTAKRLETQNKYIESFLHTLNIDIPIARIETLKKNIQRKSSVENTCLQEMYTKLDEALKVVVK